jgi:hypothetical protein
MICRTVENRFLEWKATVAVCQNSGKRWVLTYVRDFLAVFRCGMLNLLKSSWNRDEIVVL